MSRTIRINYRTLRWAIAIILIAISVFSIIPKTILLFTRLGNVDLATYNINAGPTLPKSYEYDAALWIKKNTPPNTVIISDPVTIETLSALADRIPIAQINMGNPSRLEDKVRINIIYQLLVSVSDLDVYAHIEELRKMGITTEEFYRSFRPMQYAKFIVIVSERTSLWLDVGGKYPIVYFNERAVNSRYISKFLNSELFELSYQVEGKIYVFEPRADFLVNAADYSDSVVDRDEGLIFHLSFDDGINQEQVAFNVTAVEGRVGKAVYFNGLNSYISIPHFDALNVREAITLEAWVRPEPDMPTRLVWNIIIAKGSPAKYMLFYNNQINRITMGVRIGNVGYWVDAPFTIDGTWHHVVGVYVSGDYRLYLDGKLVSRRTDVSGLLDSDELPLTVGTLYGYIQHPPQSRWRGAIDEIRIYNRALSEREIIEHFELKFHKVAKLGNIEMPFEVPCSCRIEFKLKAMLTENSQNSTVLTFQVLDDKGNVVYIKDLKANEFNKPDAWQLVSVGITGLMNSDRKYTIKVFSTSASEIFIDYIIGRLF